VNPRARDEQRRGSPRSRIPLGLLRLAPVLFGLLALLLWEAAVRLAEVPAYLLPGPIAIAGAFAADPVGLLQALAATLIVTFAALLVAALLGGAMAVAMSASRLAQAAIQPWAVALQVTPLPAIAPLIIIWVGEPFAALVVCATIIAFFPLFANTAAGLASSPPELNDLFRLYGAGRWQTMSLLRLPAALPHFLTGLRISGGLALVGAVVAELVAGSGGFASGLAYRILEASFRLEMPRMFAALVLLALAGIVINFGLGAVGQAILRRRGVV
jgi:NitT/TauT family transport system permease protein